MDIHKQISKLVYPLTYKKVYTASWKISKELEKSQWFSQDEIKSMQWKKIKDLLHHAYKNVTFYNDLFKKNSIHPSDIKDFSDFNKLPVISKKDFLNYSQKQCTAGNISKNRVMYGSSSGSTGTPFEYGSDKAELGFRHLLQFRSFNWAGWKLGDKYIYFDGMIGGGGFKSFTYKLYLVYTNYLTRRWHVFSPEINSDEGMMNTLMKMLQYKPKMIRTTMSQIRLIMRFVKVNNFPFPQVPIITVGETITEHDRKNIKEILGCEIFESYGAGEFAAAYECNAHNGLHVAEENVHLEVIANNRIARPGEQGRIVITNLHNYVWPFIRYDMGDVGILSDKKCSCGRNLQLLDEVSGRVSEFVVTSDDKLLGLHDFTQIIGHNVDYIKQWQIIQERKGEINAFIVPTEKMNPNAEKKIINDIKISANNQLNVSISLVNEIPMGISDKRLLIKSKVKMEF